MSRPGKIVVYRDNAGLWRWRKTTSGRITADSGQGYKRRRDVIRGIESTWPGCLVGESLDNGSLCLYRLSARLGPSMPLAWIPISVPGDPAEWRSRR